MKQEIEKLIIESLAAAFDGLEPTTVELEHPADPEHGEWSTNVALKLTKQLAQPPRAIAEKLLAQIQQNLPEFVEKVAVAGPGFINFQLSPKAYLQELLEVGSQFGRSKIGDGKTIMIEFGQPNTHKAFHVGHLKSAISGLAMVKLYENLGYKVIKA